MKSKKYLVAAGYPLAATFVALLLWTAIVWVFEFPEWFLPTPLVIIEELILSGFNLLPDAWITLVETMLGFLLAIILGFAVAILLVWSVPVKRSILPLLVFLQTLPKIAIAPLFIIWFGFGILSKVIMAFLVCFFPIVINTSVGLASVESEMMDLIKSMAATKRQTFIKVRIPNALPYFFTSLKIAITLALIGAIVGEFVGGEAGLGYQIIMANARMNAPKLFAIILILGFLGAGLFYIISGLERFFIPWKPTGEVGRTITTGTTM